MENNIVLTKNAQIHIANIIQEDKSNYFRITVLGGGCAGFQYKFEFDNLKKKDDIEILKGCEIDYVNELIGSSFKIKNPQAASSCGCGTSFSL